VLPGDILTHMNGEKISDGRAAMNQVADFEPGTQIPVKLLRNGQSIDRVIRVGQRPNSASN
jgi:serine protease DegS